MIRPVIDYRCLSTETIFINIMTPGGLPPASRKTLRNTQPGTAIGLLVKRAIIDAPTGRSRR
jgi:hypothetical protein